MDVLIELLRLVGLTMLVAGAAWAATAASDRLGRDRRGARRRRVLPQR
ncbi:MAG: hypothetical protein OES57_00295 [Acidimicrobiia bacterium]|nr:hypothetical protein [Acidimicrobiia bacterium]